MSRASNVRTLFIVLLVLFASSVCAVNVYAQVAGGTISGTVSDSSGRLINSVQITITNVATGVTRDVTTNEDGFYSAPNLLPGTYEAKFSAQGFKTEARRGIELTVGASIGLDQTMRVGSISETVEVQSEVPAVQLSTSDMSAVVNATVAFGARHAATSASARYEKLSGLGRMSAYAKASAKRARRAMRIAAAARWRCCTAISATPNAAGTGDA